MTRILMVLVALASLAGRLRAEDPFDLVLRGGRIVDGTGAPWYFGDVGIRGGRIVTIGRLADAPAKRVIDATGLTVAPGFIDMMGQTATPMLRDPRSAMNVLTQGITTINAGEGVSAAPVSEADAKAAGWRTMGDYFALIEKDGLPINVAQTIGHTQVRQIVLGEVDRRPTPEELQAMQALVDEAMQAGAIGVSTALIYPPATYASTEEIAALCEVAGRYGGRYYTHMRNEGDHLLDAIDEALEIGRLGRVPVHIFHLKAAGQQNWGKMEEAIAKIKAARMAGQQVTADIYPYINNGLGLEAFVHPKHFGEGRARFQQRLDDAAFRRQVREEMETTDGWENWFRHTGHDWSKVIIGRTTDKAYRPLAGQSVQAIAETVRKDPWDVFFELVRSDTFALPQTMADANLLKAMREPFVSFCTDVGPADESGLAGHPRAAGAFPRLMSRYVRELGVIPLERAVAQASALAANEVLAYDRGRISEGLAADVIVFDAERFLDRATFAEPLKPAEGMRFVIVNGEVVLDDGQFTGARPGRVLKGPGFRGLR